MEAQNELIKKHLVDGNSITSLEALKLFGCLRLSGRIYDLKKEGLPITAKTKTTDSGKRVAEYYIEKEALIRLTGNY